jgi:hypothetical protein
LDSLVMDGAGHKSGAVAALRFYRAMAYTHIMRFFFN